MSETCVIVVVVIPSYRTAIQSWYPRTKRPCRAVDAVSEGEGGSFHIWFHNLCPNVYALAAQAEDNWQVEPSLASEV